MNVAFVFIQLLTFSEEKKSLGDEEEDEEEIEEFWKAN